MGAVIGDLLIISNGEICRCDQATCLSTGWIDTGINVRGNTGSVIYAEGVETCALVATVGHVEDKVIINNGQICTCIHGTCDRSANPTTPWTLTEPNIKGDTPVILADNTVTVCINSEVTGQINDMLILGNGKVCIFDDGWYDTTINLKGMTGTQIFTSSATGCGNITSNSHNLGDFVLLSNWDLCV